MFWAYWDVIEGNLEETEQKVRLLIRKGDKSDMNADNFGDIFADVRATMMKNYGVEVVEEWEAEIKKAGLEASRYIDAIVGMELVVMSLVPLEAADVILGSFLNAAFFFGITREKYPEIYRAVLDGME